MSTKDNRFNIIHLSDTHICKNNVNDLVCLRKALIEDIKKNLSKDEIQSSIICFTGDLIFRGDYGYNIENQYSIAINELILPLSIELGLDLKSFFFVPGNHEIDLTKINKIYDVGLFDTLNNYNGILAIDYKQETLLRSRLDDYRKFESELNSSNNDDIVNSLCVNINNCKVGICLINTSWNLASDSQNDKGKIIIGKNRLAAGLQKIQNCDYKICLLHHPISWLKDEDEIGIEPLLGNFDLVLYGHSHYASQKQILSPNGKSVYCMASELLPISVSSGYNLIRFDANYCTVMQRLYFSQRNEFDSDLSVQNGQQVFTIGKPDEKTILFDACIHTKKGFIEKLNTISMTSLIHEEKKPFDDYYIIPKLSCDNESVSSEIEKTGTETIITPLEIVNSTDNYVIYGKKDYGKTLLLHYIAELYYLNVYSKKLPLIIDCKKINNNESSIIKEIRSYILNLADDNYKISTEEITRLLSSGGCILLFDNFITSDKNTSVIAEFVKKYANNKRIFAVLQTPSNLLENRIADEIDTQNINYKRVYMGYMSKNDIRKMAKTLSTCDSSELTSFTNRIVSCFNKTYLPRTPFAVALVVEICNANSDYEPVNLSAVIKRYMEIVLDRLSPKELLVNEYNFDIKEDFLSFIAYKMVKTNCFEVPIEQFDKWSSEYHDNNGFSVRETHFDNYFFACNVLSSSNGKVSFKYACLLEYYIGKYASVNPSFLNDILSKDKYINFINEIIYCAGIDTRNPQIIDTLGSYVQENVDARHIDTSFLSGDRIKLDLSISEEEVRATIIEKQMTDQEVDIVTDSKDNSSEYLPSRISKTRTYDETKYKLDCFDALLCAFGSSIRNSELIGYSKRYNAFEQYMNGSIYWCSILAESVEEFIKVVRQDILENDKIDQAAIDVDKIEDSFRDFCRIIIPCTAETNLFEALGTKKLSKIFTDYYYSILNYNALDKFIALLTVLDLKTHNWKELFEDFMQKSDSKDLRIILFVKMIYLYKICHFGKSNNVYLQEKLFSLNKSIDKKIGNLGGRSKTEFINRINSEQQKRNQTE